MRKKLLLLPFLISNFIFLHAQPFDGELTIDGAKRTFHFYSIDKLPENRVYPLVIMLHGGGSTGTQMIRFTKFNLLAERDTFLMVYPDGWKHQWNDHRVGDDLPSDKDDVKFISALIDYLIQKHQVDSTRVFVTGISNGAIMSFLLAQEISQKIRAIAPVCGSIPENYFTTYNIEKPLSVIVINGTSDPLVHYQGGAVGKSGWQRGALVATDSSIKKIVALDHCSPRDSSFNFPDINLKDMCSATKKIWKCGNNEVQLIKVIGGGHTWPGGVQYLPKSTVGRACKDFNASSEIWNFFNTQPTRE